MNAPPNIATPAIRSVPAADGTQWIANGYALFRQAPGTWIGLLLAWLAINLAIAAVGGQLISTFLNPVLQAGMMLGCVSLSGGDGLRVGHLFEAFRGDRVGSLLMMGLIQLGLSLALGVLVVAALFLAMPGAWGSGLDFENLDLSHLDFGHFNLLAILLVVLLAVSLAIPLAMLAWFAPVLIVLRGQPAWAAMKLSLAACLQNWKPFLLYGLLGLGLLLLGALPLLLGWLVVLPVLAASLYCSYLAIFPE